MTMWSTFSNSASRAGHQYRISSHLTISSKFNKYLYLAIMSSFFLWFSPYFLLIMSSKNISRNVTLKNAFIGLSTQDMGPSIQESIGLSNICGRQPLKNLKGYGLLKHIPSYPFNFFKGCLPQILLGPFLNTLSHRFLGQFPLTTDHTRKLSRKINNTPRNLIVEEATCQPGKYTQ